MNDYKFGNYIYEKRKAAGLKDRGVEPLPPVIASFGAFPSFRLDVLTTRLHLKNEKSLKIYL